MINHPIASYRQLFLFVCTYIGHEYVGYLNPRKKVSTEPSPVTAPVSPDSKVIRLYGLPFTVTQQEICEFFYGTPLLAVHFMRNEATGKRNGAGYIEVQTDEQVNQVTTNPHNNPGNPENLFQ